MGQLIQFRFPAQDPWGFEKMNKMELLEELVRFQEDRRSVLQISPDLIQRGKKLFSTLEKVAETPELRMLCRGYLSQLDVSQFLIKNGLVN